MSANDRNEKFADKNDRYAMDNEAAPDGAEGELSQDELNNVSGGLRILKDPAGASNAEGMVRGKVQGDDDKSDGSVRI